MKVLILPILLLVSQPYLPVQAEEETGSLVLLTYGTDPQQDQIERAIRSQISDLDVELVVVRKDSFPEKLLEQVAVAVEATRRHHAAAVCWWNAGVPAGLEVYVDMSPSARLLSRDVCADEEAGCAEEVAIIVRSTWRAVSMGVAVGVDVAEIPVEPVPPPPLRPLGPLTIQVGGMGYGHNNNTVFRPGLDVEVSGRLTRRGRLSLHLLGGVSLLEPVDGDDSHGTYLKIQFVQFQIGLRLAIRLTEWLSLAPAPSMVLAPTSQLELLHLNDRLPREWKAYVMVGLRAQVQLTVTPFPQQARPLAFFVAGQMVLPFNPMTWNDRPLPDAIIASWPVYPALVVGGMVRLP